MPRGKGQLWDIKDLAALVPRKMVGDRLSEESAMPVGVGARGALPLCH